MKIFETEDRLIREMTHMDATFIGLVAMIGAGIFLQIGTAAGWAGHALFLVFSLIGNVSSFTVFLIFLHSALSVMNLTDLMVLFLFFSPMALTELNVAREIVIIGFTTIITLGVLAVVITARGGKTAIQMLFNPSEEKLRLGFGQGRLKLLTSSRVRYDVH